MLFKNRAKGEKTVTVQVSCNGLVGSLTRNPKHSDNNNTNPLLTSLTSLVDGVNVIPFESDPFGFRVFWLRKAETLQV